MAGDAGMIRPLAITSILVPLDGSRLSEETLEPAMAIAGRLGAAVTLLHVLEHGAPATVHGEAHLIDATAAETYLSGLAERLRASGGTIATHVHANPEHDVSRSIVEHAAELGSDLVVLAAHGAGGIRGFIFGRVAQQVLRRGTCPVFMVQVAEGSAESAPFACGVVALLLDGTAEAESALPASLALAAGFGALLHLIRATPTVWTVGGDRAASATLIPGTARAVLDLEAEEAQGYLARIAASLAGRGTEVRTSVVRGDAAGATVAEARRIGADVLALATHGHQGLSGVWAGSTGSKVLGRFTRPVLLVRSP